MTKYLKIKDGLFLTSQKVSLDSQKEKIFETNTQHIFVIDCSGSMSGELSDIRLDLFNKISTILKPNDSVTIIWFSGRGQFGVLLEDYNVHSNIALEKVRELINKHLTPQGLTAFKEPLTEVKKVIDRIRSNNPDMAHSLFFLTDGCDNQYSTKEILNATSDLREYLNSAIIIEYGYYCNKELMSQMAQEIGGVHVFSKDFQDYEPYIKKQFSNESKSKRKYVKIENSVKNDLVFNIIDNDIILYKINENNEILLNVEEDTNVFYFTDIPTQGEILDSSFVEKSLKSKEDSLLIKGLYASLFAFSRKSDYNMVSELLKITGDAYLIKEKSNTFGTQKINELEQKFLEATNNAENRYVEGYNPNLEPAEDAYCVLNLLDDLMIDEDNMWYPQHDSFNYKRIGSKTVAKMADLSDEDRKKVNELLDKNKLDEATKFIDEIKKNQPKQLEFKYDGDMQGFPISNLVWNETRANLSVQVNYKGYVELPENNFNLPKNFPTNQFRNYTLIKDGVIFNYTLPVSLSESTFNKLQSNDLLKGETYKGVDYIYTLDFSSLPSINRKMASTLSAKELFTNEWELIKLKASNSAFNFFKKRHSNNVDSDFSEKHGVEASEWLYSMGVKEYGFSPNKKIEKTEEKIDVNILEVKIEKLNSSITKKDFDSADQKIKNGDELTPKESLMEDSIKEFNQFTSLIKEVKDKDNMLNEWLSDKSKSFRTKKNKLMSDISKAKFLTIVGKSWFVEFPDRSQNEMTLNLDSKDIKFKVEDKMETITI